MSGVTPEMYHADGVLVLHAQDTPWQPGEECEGTDEYVDVRTGVPVVVTDQSGRVLATTTIEPGVPRGSEEATTTLLTECHFQFSVSVPRAETYVFDVGGRGAVTYTYDELVNDGWDVSLTLGD